MSFRGLDKWRRNLQLLVPFLEDASVELLTLDPVEESEDGAQLLKVRPLHCRIAAHTLFFP